LGSSAGGSSSSSSISLAFFCFLLEGTSSSLSGVARARLDLGFAAAFAGAVGGWTKGVLILVLALVGGVTPSAVAAFFRGGMLKFKASDRGVRGNTRGFYIVNFPARASGDEESLLQAG